MRSLARWIYAVSAAAFVLGVAVQVYLVGLAVVAGRIGFASHVALGHALAAPLLLMLIFGYVGRARRSTMRWTWVLFGVYVLQADVLIFLRSSVPELAALHPVLALVDIVLGVVLLRAAWRLIREPIEAPAPTRLPAGAS